VQNRVNQIRSLVPSEAWAHCPGHENPADMPSRGVNFTVLLNETCWINGPTWLTEMGQPSENFDAEVPCECLQEMKAPKILSLFVDSSQSTEAILDCGNYSSLLRLLRVTALVFKFVSILRSKVKGSRDEVDSTISPENIQAATDYWIKNSQLPLWKDKRFQSWEVQFGIYKDEKGLLRCRGRLGNSSLPYFTKHPLLLNSKHHFTVLVVRHCHQIVKHGGVKETLKYIYWIIQGRNFVRRLLRQCVVCQRFTGKPYSTPLPAPLPGFFVREALLTYLPV